MCIRDRDIPWRIQIEDIINIEKDAFLNTYRMEKGGQVLNYFIMFFFPCQAKNSLFFNRAFPILVTKLIYDCVPKLKTFEFLPY